MCVLKFVCVVYSSVTYLVEGPHGALENKVAMVSPTFKPPSVLSSNSFVILGKTLGMVHIRERRDAKGIGDKGREGTGRRRYKCFISQHFGI